MVGGKKAECPPPENLPPGVAQTLEIQNRPHGHTPEEADDRWADSLDLPPEMGMNAGFTFIFPGHAVVRSRP